MSQYLVHPYYFSIQKRIFDIIFSILGLVILLPFFLLAYLLFIFFLGKPFLYKQIRMGNDKKHFIIYKVRTMKLGSSDHQEELQKYSSAPYPMFKVENDPRFNTFGKLLSNFGLDELPQIINILKGDMSFIGPRPLPVQEANKLPSSWNFRYDVRPGILSEWALSPNRYESLATWKKLEKQTLRSGSLINDVKLIFKAMLQIFLKISL